MALWVYLMYDGIMKKYKEHLEEEDFETIVKETREFLNNHFP